MAQQAPFYLDLIMQLLYLESVDEIQRSVKDTPGLDADKLYQALNSLVEKSLEEGKTAKYQLLIFVKNAIDSALQESDAYARSADEIATADELIQLALTAPTAIRVHTILRKHRHLLSAKLYTDIEQHISSNQRAIMNPTSPEIARWHKLLCVISLLLGDKVIAVKGYVFWATYCRKAGYHRNALRRLNHAAQLSEDLDDAFLKILVVSAQASLYDRIGENVKAVEIYSKALEIAERSNQELEAFSIRKEMANCYRSLGRYSEALELINAYLPIAQKFQRSLQETHYRVLKGLVLEDLGRYEEGVVEYEKAGTIAKSLGDQKHQFEAMNNIAASFLKRGNYRKAVKQFRSIIRTVEGWGNPIMVASSQNNLGTALLQAGRAAEALTAFRSALEVKLNSGERYGEAISLCGMGDSLLELGDRNGAKTFYQFILVPAIESNNLEICIMYASRMLQKGFDIGENTVEIISSLRESSRQRGLMFQELQCSSLLIQHYLHQGDELQAVALYQEAIQRGKAHDERSPLVMKLQVNYAKLLSKKPEGRQEAYNLLTNTLAAVERQMDEVLLDRRRGEIIATWFDLYGVLINLLIESGEALQLPRSIAPSELAFNLHESAKSRSFVASLAKTTISPPASIPQHLQEREAHLLSLERSLQDHEDRQEVKSEAYRLQRLREISSDLRLCWEEMRTFAPEYFKLRLGELTTLQDLKLLLSNQSGFPMAFVSFFCEPDRTTCFVVRSDEQEIHIFHSNLGRDHLMKVAKSLQREFNGAPTEFPPYAPIRRDKPWKRNLSLFEELSGELLKFLPVVQGVQLLCIAPHGPLHLLPLHALRTPDGKYLLEHFACTYCPSFSTLSYCLLRALPQSSGKPSVYVAGVASREDKKLEFFEQDCEIFDNQKWIITADIGTVDAAKAQVLQQLSDIDYDVVHLTCHGYFDDKDPLNSGLLFSNGLEKPPRFPKSVSIFDRKHYLITARDFLRTRMNTYLMTLRACSTGIQAERNAGDEFEGISRALLYAGNAAVIVSLWNVDQESSQKLLANFYRYWTEADPPVEKWRAFWQAQRDFLAATEELFLSHPYHWAPLILIGDWR
ncbi:MAG: tetratricopeptide repeat protein [Scytonema hyalinum WJT4-NPBG1]|jgi:tetratricopeptide (TPR) repeat protein|nr:tetratricopeptide repeat protein [Scytonema hyalinum WJT4-NPBG1]